MGLPAPPLRSRECPGWDYLALLRGVWPSPSPILLQPHPYTARTVRVTRASVALAPLARACVGRCLGAKGAERTGIAIEATIVAGVLPKKIFLRAEEADAESVAEA